MPWEGLGGREGGREGRRRTFLVLLTLIKRQYHSPSCRAHHPFGVCQELQNPTERKEGGEGGREGGRLSFSYLDKVIAPPFEPPCVPFVQGVLEL